MAKRLIFLALVGGGGLAILLSLGIWQVQRLAWKQELLAGIEARIADAPVALPDSVDPDADRYLPVTATGKFGEARAQMLASRRGTGAVHRHIVPFETSNRRVLVDLGWTRADKPLGNLPGTPITLVGNLDWPRETDGFTPPPDLAKGQWYARDVPALAAALETEPVMIVLRDLPDVQLPATPWPVDTAGIPNDHLQYAFTWFSLAAIWAGMTLYFGLRGLRSQKEG